MRQLDYSEVRKRMLDTLDVFASFCENHGLKYSLAFGTLIGAIRHKGFIPWDDDIDVFMPMPDYIKFFKTFSDNRYFASEIMNNKEHEYPFGRLYDSQTFCFNKLKKKNKGIFVDIYPICGLENPLDITDIASRMNRLYNIRRKIQVFVRILSILNLQKFAISCRAYFIKKQNMLYQKYSYENSNYVYQATLEKQLPKFLFEKLVEVDFEGKKYKAFEGFDTILRNQYGDYMQFPPKEEQIPNHGGFKYYIDK